MFTCLLSALFSIRAWFRTRAALQIEILALRHQLTVLKRSQRGRLRLHSADRVLWVWLSRFWSNWRSALLVVKPETVIAWHRKGFRIYWTWKSHQAAPGRPTVALEVRDLIRKMSLANPLWGAPRIHGELLKLGIEVSQATVAKYMARRQKPPSQTWRTFLNNHVKGLVSTDFFVVPTISFRVLFVFVVLAHHRRRLIHFNVTAIPHRNGRPNKSRRRSLGRAPHGICYMIATRFMETCFARESEGWRFVKSSRHQDRLGKTLMRSA